MTTINVKDSSGATVALEKPLVPGQAVMASSRPVVIASDQSTVPVSLASVPSHAVTNAGTFAAQAAQSGTWTVQPGNTANTTAWKVDGSAVTQPVSGTVSANATQTGTWTVQPGNTANTTAWLAKISDGTNAAAIKAASTAPIATDPALVVAISPNSVNANGQATMANSAPVTIASDQTYGNSTGSAVPAKATYEGANAITALPSAATNGNLVGLSSDKFGRVVTQPITIRDLVGTQTTTISASTSETTIVTAAASTFNDLVMLVVSNTSASTTTRIDFRDTTGGSILFSLTSIGGQPPVGFCPAVAIPQTTVNTNWTAQCSASTTDVRVYAVYAKNK